MIVNAVFVPVKASFLVKKADCNLSFFNINGFWLPQSYVEEAKLSIPFLEKCSYYGVYRFYDWGIGKEE